MEREFQFTENTVGAEVEKLVRNILACIIHETVNDPERIEQLRGKSVAEIRSIF